MAYEDKKADFCKEKYYGDAWAVFHRTKYLYKKKARPNDDGTGRGSIRTGKGDGLSVGKRDKGALFLALRLFLRQPERGVQLKDCRHRKRENPLIALREEHQSARK